MFGYCCCSVSALSRRANPTPKCYCCCCLVTQTYLIVAQTSWTAARRLPWPSLSPRVGQIHVHWVGDTIQPSHPLLLPSPLAFNLSQHRSYPMSQLFESGGRVWEIQHQSFQWIFRGLISFRMDWLDLLAVQGTLKSLLQHHSSKASVLQHSVFFMVQLSQPYKTTVWLGETTGRTIALTIKNFKWDSVTVELDFKFNGIQIYIAMWI